MNAEILALRSKTNHSEEELQMVLAARDECIREGKRKELAECLLVLAFLVKWVRSDTDAPPFVRSGELANEALAIFRETGDKTGIIGALLAASPFVQPDLSAEMVDEATDLAEELGDELTIAGIISHRAKRGGLSNPKESIALLNQAIEIYRRHGHERGVASCLFSLAIQGDDRNAKMEAALESAAIYRAVGDRHSASRSMTIASMNAAETATIENRKAIALQGLEDAQAAGSRSQEGVFYAHLAKIAKDAGDKKEAAKYRRWAKDLDDASGTPKPSVKEAKAFVKELAKQAPGFGKIKGL